MNQIDEAVRLFREGCACSQAVLAIYGPQFGLPEAVGMRVAATFPAGMRRADTCGAVMGALMALGLAYCGEDCKTVEP